MYVLHTTYLNIFIYLVAPHLKKFSLSCQLGQVSDPVSQLFKKCFSDNSSTNFKRPYTNTLPFSLPLGKSYIPARVVNKSNISVVRPPLIPVKPYLGTNLSNSVNTTRMRV